MSNLLDEVLAADGGVQKRELAPQTPEAAVLATAARELRNDV